MLERDTSAPAKTDNTIARKSGWKRCPVLCRGVDHPLNLRCIKCPDRCYCRLCCGTVRSTRNVFHRQKVRSDRDKPISSELIRDSTNPIGKSEYLMYHHYNGRLCL